MKKSAVIGGLIFMVGCLIFCVTMSFLKWDFTKLSNRPPFEEITTVVENNNQTITLESNNVDITVALSQDNKIHFIYSEREKEFYEFENKDDIEIKKINNYAWYEYWAVMDFHRERPFTILLPTNFTGKLDLTTSNAVVKVEDVSLQNIVAVTSNNEVTFCNVNVVDDVVIKTSNNSVDFNGLKANGKIELTTCNGSVTLNDISTKDIIATTSNNRIFAKDLVAADNINLSTSNGKIEFDLISAKESIILSTNNNEIKGILYGKISDYNITSKTSNGKNSLPERMPDGQTTLNISTTNGDIDILFD